MQALDREQLTQLLKAQRVRPRLVRDLRFVPEEITDWHNRELLAISTRSGAAGVLLIETGQSYVLPYELTTKIADKTTGRTKAVICDFCYTWQRGSNAARITFLRPSDSHSFTFLCCADLACSLHVRNLTPQASLSRSQLREDLSPAQRVQRLREKLDGLIALLDYPPLPR
jgi:hypothetical protein